MPKFSVSLGYFFTNVPLAERFHRASQSGFAAVEMFWPSSALERSRLLAAQEQTGMDVALFNMNEGDYKSGDRGFACRPEKRAWWRDEFDSALELAISLNCGLINVLSGRVDPGAPKTPFFDCMVENLLWAAPRARQAGVRLLIEPLNRLSHPFQLCQQTPDVLRVLDAVHSPVVGLQYDVFHAQSGEGNIVDTLRKQIDRIGHVQIADVPSRSAPGTGELNFPYILDELDRIGYSGYVGLEYLPPTSGDNPFDWMKEYSHGKH